MLAFYLKKLVFFDTPINAVKFLVAKVIQLPNNVNCKVYISNNKNLAASLSFNPTDALYYDTLQISGYKYIGTKG